MTPMQRKTFRDMVCPIARTLDRVGEWWSILILRDAFLGLTRFDQFRTSLDIAPNMLTRRLSALVEAGLLERKLYSKHPPRYEYLLTDKGRDFWSVLVALMAYGTRHFAQDGAATRLVDSESEKPIDPVFVDRESGRTLDETNVKFVAGPSASPAVRVRMRHAEQRRKKNDGGKEWDEYVSLRRKAPARASRKRSGGR
jgi:DNA-binding HxlR family transcriptional regulator